jgi:hypothetical protein
VPDRALQGSPTEIQIPTILVPDRAQHDRPAVYVIAQQYSSATFVSLRFHSRLQKFGALLIKALVFILYSVTG